MSITLFVVVEDKAEEQQHALAAIKQALVPEGDEEIPYAPESDAAQLAYKEAKVMVFFAPTLAKARQKLDMARGFGDITTACVLTDLMFPADKGKKEEPNGLSVLVACIENDFPVVVCSDTDHHDVNYLKDVFPVLAKAHPKGEIPVILDEKDWGRAVTESLRMLGKPALSPV